ncbi:hypothetical protein ACKWTF_014525 [Chironomus riparius]
MMEIKLIFLTICILQLFNLSTQSITIDCDYNSKWTYQIVGAVYRCEVKNNINITATDESTISTQTGTHVSGYANGNVYGFDIRNKVVKYFPQGIEKIFTALTLILINDGHLKEIHQKDIKPFTSLKVLDLQGNDIGIIEEGTFDMNTALQYVWLPRNKIMHVDLTVFDKLASLSTLSFYKNKCLDTDAAFDAATVKQLIVDIKASCNSADYLSLNTTLKALQKDLKTLKLDNFEAYSERVEELETKFMNSKFSYFTTFEARLEALKNDPKFTEIENYHNLKKRIDDLETEDIAEKLKEIEAELEKFEGMTSTRLGQKVENFGKKLDNFIKDTSDRMAKVEEAMGITSTGSSVATLSGANVNAILSEYEGKLTKSIEKKLTALENKIKKMIADM